MADAAEKIATYQDVLDAPSNVVAEIIGGRLVTHPRPAAKHSLSGSRLGTKIGGPFDLGEGGPGGWWILDEPELHLGSDIVVPDLAGWRRERMPEFPDTAWIDLAPDWACEVISPSTARYDRGEKREIYAREGVTHLWHVDPIDRLLEAFELQDGNWVLLKTLKNDEEVALPPFAAVPFSLGALWPD
ncbi:MAG: Uma2 family endonuclease [Alphaproteobacteria bacterium]|nr:Uma2 family endonuclease [Alphaproteobacteria bacterium]